MSWDTTACFKALSTAFCDFQRQPSDTKTVQALQRQIDVILGLTSHGAILNDFTPKELVYAETLSALVSIINDPNLKVPLYQKSLMALVQLADDRETKVSLQKDFNLGSSVVQFILRHIASSNKQIVYQALVLLEKMTYGSTCYINNIYMVDLLKHLISSIYTTAHEYCIPSLAILANLCRHNEDVKTFIKTMNDAKKFGKTLLGYLSNSNKKFIITSLSILSNLYLHDSLGENMFNEENLVKMIRLVFNALIGADDVANRYYAVDLVIDFIKCDKTLKIIACGKKLSTDTFQILNLLNTTDAGTAFKVFELLIEYCKQPVLAKNLITVFAKNINEAETQVQDDVVLSPAQSLLHWISRSEREGAVVQTNILALVFLKDFLTEIVNLGYMGNVTVYVHQIISSLLPHLTIDVKVEDLKKMTAKFRKLSCVYEVVSTLCKDNGLRDVIVSQVDFDGIFNVITNILDEFSEDLGVLRDPTIICKEELVSAVFRGLELISAVKHKLDSGLTRYSSMVQNIKLVPFLSHGFASKCKFLVHASLLITAEGMKGSDFQSKLLGDTLTFHNSSRKESTSGVSSKINNQSESSQVSSTENRSLRDITNSNINSLSSKSIPPLPALSSLTERLDKGLDIKDAKVSEIMGFYEHKFSAIMGREKHIQDLLETKSQTLAQTERLLAEFRCRHAQSEAEYLKLSSMLHASERKCENNLLVINELKKTQMKTDAEIKMFQEKVQHLETVAAEHRVLQSTFEEHAEKLKATEKSLDEAKERVSSLEATKKELLKHSETLKIEVDRLNENLHTTDEEKKQLLSALKDKEKELKKLEKTLKESKEKVNALEAHTQELEQSIGEKESKITHLSGEIEKFSQISAMIHNLTGGPGGLNMSK